MSTANKFRRCHLANRLSTSARFQLRNEKWGSKDQDQQETSHPPEHYKQPEGQTIMETGDSAALRSHSAFIRTALVWFRGHMGGTKSRLDLLPPRQRLDQPTVSSCIKEVTVLPRAQCGLKFHRSANSGGSEGERWGDRPPPPKGWPKKIKKRERGNSLFSLCAFWGQ